jgi:hypothetical protein
MACGFRILGLTIAVLLSPALAVAQDPPTKVPVSPLREQRDPQACAHSDTQATVGKGGKVDMQHDSNGNLSNKLARSGGVICPPEQIDPEIKRPTPPDWSDAGHPASRKSGRGSIHPAEMTTTHNAAHRTLTTQGGNK